MVAPILGCQDDEALPHAVDYGIAMQLTNILRDIGEDARRDRLYLPLEDLAAFGCDPEVILRGRPSEQFADLLAFEIERARALYGDARRGLPALPPSGRLTALAGSELYASILTRIVKMNYAVLDTRAHVSTRRTPRALPGIAITFAHLSWSTSRGNQI
jgi:phytoene synthase